MTDTTDHSEQPGDVTADDYEYDEAHGGGDTGQGVPAALKEEAQQRRDLSPH